MSEKVTAENIRARVEEIVGASMKEIKERVDEGRRELIADTLYAAKHMGPGAKKRSADEVAGDFACYLGCLAQERNPTAASKVAKQVGNNVVAKALATTTVAAGGVLVNPEFASEVIELLRADAIMTKMGARYIPMDSGILRFGNTTTGATAAYRGEGAAHAVSTPVTGEVIMSAKLLSVMCAVSNQLINNSGGVAAQYIKDELVAAATDKMDAAMIRSDGTSYEPRGLRYWASTSSPDNVFDEANAGAATGTSTAAEISSDLGKAIQYLMDQNVKFKSPGWLFAPRTWKALFTKLDSNNNFIFRDELRAGKLFEIPFAVTTNIPITLTAPSGSGGGADGSEVILADFFHVLIGETQGLKVSVSNEASYTVSGSQRSSFEYGETLTLVEMEHDLMCRQRGKEVVVIETTWGTV